MRPSGQAVTSGWDALCWLRAAHSDTVDARCDTYPNGSDHVARVLACTYSQRQGHVSIDRADGVRHELSPRQGVGNYIDQAVRRAIRSAGLGRTGQIYHLAHETIYVYWDTAGLPGQAGPSPTGAKNLRLPPSATP